MSPREPVAIVGIGCRFPGASGPEEFWRLLRDGVEAVRDVPASRWDREAFYDPDPAAPGKMSCRRGGFLEGVDRFDAPFFGLSPRELQATDPQQRLLLEVAWEALEDAGQAPDELAGTPVGVFMGVSSFDYYELLSRDPARFDAYTGTGNLSAVKANRLSYFFDLKGPSLAVDTACSSSLVAVHLACQSLWSGESTLALVGGVHLLLSPGMSVAYAKGGFMAPDGRCKAFDACADGYVRGEGAGIAVLRPLSAAEARGDRIYALVLGSAVNQDGASNGITAPNPLAQAAVLEAAYRAAGVPPGTVRYVEAHGTGTKLGDPIEMKALAAVLSRERAPGDTCAVGSVKTNIGHLEAAAGIAGLVKVALSLAHREVPPSLHFETPNPYIPFDTIPLRVQTRLAPWPGPAPAVAGVSSFGFGGTNAHVVLGEAPERPRARRGPPERPGHVLCLSARSEEALLLLAGRYARHLRDHPELRVADVCHTAAAGRSHFKHRLAVAGTSAEGLSRALEAAAARRDAPGLVRGEAGGRHRPAVAFVFGRHAPGPGRALFESEPVLRAAVRRCEAALRDAGEAPLLDAPPGRGERWGEEAPVVFALQLALAELWSSWGVMPDAVTGQGVGAYVAACVAGALPLGDGLRLAAALDRSPAAVTTVARGLAVGRPRVPLVSAVSGQAASDPPDPAYWGEALLVAVPLERATESLRHRGCEVLLGIGLGDSAGMAEEGAGAGWRTAHPVPSSEWTSLLVRLGRLYVRGVDPDWPAFEGGRERRRVSLPTYPFERESYWLAEGRALSHSK